MREAFQMKITMEPGYCLLLTLDTGVYTFLPEGSHF